MRASVLAATALLVLCVACLAVSNAAAQLEFETDLSMGRELLQTSKTQQNKPKANPSKKQDDKKANAVQQGRHLLEEEEELLSFEARQLLQPKKEGEKKVERRGPGLGRRHLLSDEVEFEGRELLNEKKPSATKPKANPSKKQDNKKANAVQQGRHLLEEEEELLSFEARQLLQPKKEGEKKVERRGPGLGRRHLLSGPTKTTQEKKGANQ